MRVLVTGHQGCVGTALVPMLQAAGHQVTGLDNGLFHTVSGAPGPAVRTLRLDIRDVEAEHLEGFDAVIHLAGLSNDALGSLDPALTFDINHVASVRVGAIARSVGVERFLHASSCGVYGAGGDTFRDERSPVDPLTPYAVSKLRAEQDIARLATDRFSPVFVRAASVFGAAPPLRFDLAVSNLVAWATTTGMVFLKSLGTSWRPLVHVEDIARAYGALLDAPREVVHNQAFNVGRSDQNYRIRDVAELVRQIVPGSRVERATDAGADRRNYRVNCDRIAALVPAAQPRWTVAEGAEEIYRVIRQGALGASPDFEGPRYSRIACLRQLLSARRIGPDLRWRQVEGQPARRRPAWHRPALQLP